MKPLKRFRNGQRVIVHRCGFGDGIDIDAAPGTVVRLRMADHGAWVALDKRLDIPNAHPFPADDETRGTHVLALPEDCEDGEIHVDAAALERALDGGKP